ncbi:MAG TPA: imidazoleglycerol-phosphate dehydratase HisB [Thermodesulfobacteriota bacterium]|nr:imidazoleglycerol-phosphate dehydratase HisB [Thermodesulfobacteriota bacterium]
MRRAKVSRRTKETDIQISLNLDGSGKSRVSTSIPFLDHMLTLFSAHAVFDLSISGKGDTETDYHHTAEDVGICLGQALREALGGKKGIRRYGSAFLPMDESLASVHVDLSGRPCLVYRLPIRRRRIGDFDTELVEEFLRAFVNNGALTLHARVDYGGNAHHIVESLFKALGRAVGQAVSIDERVKGVPSTKGRL